MSPAHHAIFLVFLFLFGACVGSFLNVVVWRLPAGMSLVSPGSHCPLCKHPLAWYDNVPILGWVLLRGRCRYCKAPISARYPLVELTCALLLVFYYVMFFILHVGPCARVEDPLYRFAFGEARWVAAPMRSILVDWPMFGLFMFMVCSLVAVSLIDAELFIIPIEIPWLMAGLGLAVHALAGEPKVPGAANLEVARFGDWAVAGAALAAGGGAGLLASIALHALGFIPRSFAEGEPAMEADEELWQEEVEAARAEGKEPPPKPRVYTKGEVRREIGKEALFLAAPIGGALLALALVWFTSLGELVRGWLAVNWVSGLLGSLLGALVGAAWVWVTRILGTLAKGRVAMGLGDVHLMFGVGAILGPGPVTVAFFLAPFAGLAWGLWNWITRGKHELPYGPYLSLASGAVLLCYCPIVDQLFRGLMR